MIDMMKPFIKKVLIPLVIVLNIGLNVYGFATLLSSPYTGIRMTVCGDHGCVKSVDWDSPASGTVLPGDRVLDVEGLKISYLVFNEDPDYLRSERDLSQFWISARKLDAAVVKGDPVQISIERGDKRLTVAVVPGEFPFYSAAARTAPVYCAGWAFVLIIYLVIRKRIDDTTIAFTIFSLAIGTNCIAAIPFAVRDIVFPSSIFQALSFTDFLTVTLILPSLLHLILVFPRKKRIIVSRPWLQNWVYSLSVLLLVVRLTKIIDNTQMTYYVPYAFCGVALIASFIFNLFRERDPVVRRQSKWVIFGFLVGGGVNLSLTAIPVMFGAPIVSAELSILPTVMIPLGIAFAITKYKLMEIDTIVDTAVVYGFTIFILAGVETAFLSFASPYLLTAGKGLPAFSVVAVLLIVFIYVPIRNFVKGIVERLFKRGKYDPEKELQAFTVSLGLCDERSALEKFSAFVNNLLKPSGIAVLKIEEKAASILHASNDLSRQEGEKLRLRSVEIWEQVRSKGTCAFGYELPEKIAQGGAPLTPDLESALFVPFITDPADTSSGNLAVLLKKWNETAYSVKDVTLLNAISVNIANIIEAGELRKERDAIEERFRKEKDAVMKELHDGLGNILTGITVTTQAAERMLEGARDKAGELVGRIGSFSTEAMDFLRTGLTVLDNPHGDIGSLMEAIKDRFGDMFESSGMQLNIECSEDARRLRPGALVAMNLTRVIQEALNNVMKHSTAKSVRIRTEKDGGTLSLTISDDGKGFLVGNETPGLGLASMKRRIEDMKGSLRIDSSPGKGTEIGLAVFAG